MIKIILTKFGEINFTEKTQEDEIVVENNRSIIVDNNPQDSASLQEHITRKSDSQEEDLSKKSDEGRIRNIKIKNPPGGIDMNSKWLDLQNQNPDEAMVFHIDSRDFEDLQINGLRPYIYQMTPMSSLDAVWK